VRSIFGDIQAIRIGNPRLPKDIDGVQDRGTEHFCISNSQEMEAQNKVMSYHDDNVNNIAGSTIVPQNSISTPESLMHLTGLPHDDAELHEAINKHSDQNSTMGSGSTPTMSNFAFGDTLPLFSMIDDMSPSLGADCSVLLGYI
jgi:hypothetical protein